MIVRLPDSSIQFTDQSGNLHTYTIFDKEAYTAAGERITEQAGGVSKNQTALNNYNRAVDNMQTSVDDGLKYDPSTLPPVPEMEVWPDDPAVGMSTQPFPNGLLHV